jgi:FKBP-type peptidyl-prolyl cis-trans isomerase 2
MNKGEFVRINYIGRLESGEIFDLTDAEKAKAEKIFNPKARYGPAPVIVGAGFVIPGIDRALAEMKVGEKREVVVKPEEGFGQRDSKLVRTVPQKVFRQPPQPGMVVDFGEARGRVQSVSAGRVRVDFNHPLAGKVLKYELEAREKIEGHEGQVKAVLEFFGAEKAGVKIDKGAVEIAAPVPQPLRQRISGLILEYVKGVEKVNFVESYQKAPAKEEKKA